MKLVDISDWYGNCDGSLFINPETISRIDTGIDEDDGTEKIWVSFIDDVCLVLDCGFEEFCKRISEKEEISPPEAYAKGFSDALEGILDFIKRSENAD